VRRIIAAIQILAFLLALVTPVRAAWSCPDGTPCVHDDVQGYVCAAGQCAEQASCCVAKTVRCKHGASPVVEQPVPDVPYMGTPEHCRFSVSAPPQLAAATTQTAGLQLAFDADLSAPAVQLSLSPAQPVWRPEFTLGYRPPPILSLGPSRAPPVL
jgi:hypothetical protein